MTAEPGFEKFKAILERDLAAGSTNGAGPADPKTLIAAAEAEAAEAQAAEAADPAAALAELNGELKKQLTRLRRIGTKFVVEGVHDDTGQPVEFEMPCAAVVRWDWACKHLYTALGGEMIPDFKRPDWRHVTGLFNKAAEHHHVAGDDEDTWRDCVARYAYERARDGLDPDDPGQVPEILDLAGDPFRDPRGDLWVNRDRLGAFLRGAMRVKVTDHEVGEALKRHGWTQAPRLQKRGRSPRRYWRSPHGWEGKGT